MAAILRPRQSRRQLKRRILFYYRHFQVNWTASKLGEVFSMLR